MRSITTLSSAFKSSRRARMVRSVSSALGCRATISGLRSGARESAGVFRGAGPFDALHSPRYEPGSHEDNYVARLFLARRLRAFVGNLCAGPLFPRFLFLVFAFLDWSGCLCNCVEVPSLRRARNAVEDSGDLRPCKKAHTGAFLLGREEAACSGIRTRARTLPAGLAAA